MKLAYLPTLVALVCSSSFAQTFTILHTEGQSIPGIGTLRVLLDVAVNDSGEWLVQADMELAGSTGFGDFALLGSNGVVVAPGVDLEGLPGISADFYHGIGITAAGEAFSLATLIGASIGERIGLLIGQRVVRRSGFPADADELDVAATWTTLINGPLVSPRGRIQIFGDVFPTGAPPDVEVLVEYSIDGDSLIGGAVIAAQGAPLPGQPGVTQSVRPKAVSDGPHRLFAVSGSVNGWSMYLDDSPIAIEGQPSVVPGKDWLAYFQNTCGDVNSLGGHVFYGRVGIDQDPDVVLVKNGELFRRTGETLPAISPYLIEGFSTSTFEWIDRVAITEAGHVIWSARWDDPAPGRGAGLFIEDQLLLEAGVTRVGQKTVLGLLEGHRVSPNGRWVIVRCLLADPGSLAQRTAMLIDLQAGTTYCSPASPNSTGSEAEIVATATMLTPGEPLELVAHGLPLESMGYFLVGTTADFVLQPGGSQGSLCLGGPIGRLIDQAMESGQSGYLRATVDTAALPLTPNRPIAAGETWYFQAWHRDTNPTATSNFTNAVAVTID